VFTPFSLYIPHSHRFPLCSFCCSRVSATRALLGELLADAEGRRRLPGDSGATGRRRTVLRSAALHKCSISAALHKCSIAFRSRSDVSIRKFYAKLGRRAGLYTRSVSRAGAAPTLPFPSTLPLNVFQCRSVFLFIFALLFSFTFLFNCA
jgi:hypothetical protein